jgi:GTPase SAR1 family protein
VFVAVDCGGKPDLMHRYMGDFRFSSPSIGANNCIPTVEVFNKSIEIQNRDTAVMEGCRSLAPLYCGRSVAVVILYIINDRQILITCVIGCA